MKPTNKEIASWLRQAAQTHRTAALSYKKAMWYQHSQDQEYLMEQAEERAVLVESMPDLEAINQGLVEALETAKWIIDTFALNGSRVAGYAQIETALAKAKEDV